MCAFKTSKTMFYKLPAARFSQTKLKTKFKKTRNFNNNFRKFSTFFKINLYNQSIPDLYKFLLKLLNSHNLQKKFKTLQIIKL